MRFCVLEPVPLVYPTGAGDKAKKLEAGENIDLKDYLGNVLHPGTQTSS